MPLAASQKNADPRRRLSNRLEQGVSSLQEHHELTVATLALGSAVWSPLHQSGFPFQMSIAGSGLY